MANDDLFLNIVRGDIPAQIVYQDEYVTAFHDINPQAPVHILIIPNHQVATVNDVKPEDVEVLGRLFLCAKQLAAQMKIAQDGFRLIVNCNQHGGQEVYHLHMHLLGGEPLGPMISKGLSKRDL